MSVPVRHVVELRPPRKGERILVDWGTGKGTSRCGSDETIPQWVIVDPEPATEIDSAAPVCPVEPRTGPDTTRTAEEPK